MKPKLLLGSLLALCLLQGCPGPINIRQEVKIDPTVISPSATPTPTATPDPEKEAIKQTVHDNANALNNDNQTNYFDTLHPDSPFLREGTSFYTRLRHTYLTRYNILEVSVQSLSAADASAVVKRRVTDYSGTVDQDVLYSLAKRDGKWKIKDMVIQASKDTK